MSEWEKMIAGRVYDPSDKRILEARVKAHDLCFSYNNTSEGQLKERERLLAKLCPHHKKGFYLQGPVYFDYGVNTTFGKNFYANFNFTVLDCAPVHIGDNAFFGCNVTIVTPVHPLRYQDRNMYLRKDGVATDREYAKSITIGDNCWIASNVVICGGVKIGSGVVIGAGSVVVRDIPDNVLAVGNPCQVVRTIDEKDALDLKKELF